MVADTPFPLAWAQTRHVVVSTGLMQNLDAAELQAVIAHELAHWQRGTPSLCAWCGPSPGRSP